MLNEYCNGKLEWPKEVYLTSHVNTNYASGYLLKLLHRIERNK